VRGNRAWQGIIVLVGCLGCRSHRSLSRVSISLYLNMFEFDDDELNDILMKIALDDTVTMLVTLDWSQVGGKHEKALKHHRH
jgi:hypothetical protein